MSSQNTNSFAPGQFQLRQRGRKQLPQFSNEVVKGVLWKWIEELADDPAAAPDLKTVPTFSGWKQERFEILKDRNLKEGKQDPYCLVATACCVGVGALRNLMTGDGTRKTYETTLQKICLALLHYRRIDANRDAMRVNDIKAPIPRLGRDVVEQAQLLAKQAACTVVPAGVNAATERAEFAKLCESVASDAVKAERADVADALRIAAAGAYLKAGSDLCNDKTVWTARESLSRIRQTQKHQGLRNAAALTEYKLLRELMPTVMDARQRLDYYIKAAALLELIENEQELPIQLMQPGLPNEVSKGVKGVDWGDDTHYPISGIVRRPYRFQAASLLEAAVEQWLLEPEKKDSIEKMVKKATARAGLGTARPQVSAPPRVNIASTAAHIRYIGAMMRFLSGDSRPVGRTLCEILDPFDSLTAEVDGNRQLSQFDQAKYKSLFLLAQASLNVSNEERFTAIVRDQVLPLVAASVRLRPNTRTIFTQEASFRLALLPYPDLWDCFLLACGYSKDEINQPSISEEVRMAHHRSRSSRRPR